MKNKKITRKITQGVYVLTTAGGGCVVDAVSQVSAGDNPLIAVAVMKSNYTNELMHKNDTFTLSVLGMDVDAEIIKTFGLNSMRDIDKFANTKVNDVNEEKIIEDSLGYMICEKVDTIENETHTLFIGKLIEADVYKDEEAMSYGYYQEHKDELLEVKTEEGKTAWVCLACGYVYYGDELPENFKCPKCGADANMFEKR
ncbi:MAG TPA: flavin reductase [Firmicutes bacterium]|nr:flavin reductase [Bacillota bacterium]